MVDSSFCTGPTQLLICFLNYRLVYILHELNHTVCVLVCLAFFTENEGFRDLSMLLSVSVFFSVYALFIHSPVDRHCYFNILCEVLKSVTSD